MRFVNDEVQWKPAMDCQPNLHRLIQFIAAGHDNEDIDIAIGVRFAVGVRAEEDDFLGLEFFRRFARETADDRLGHFGAVIPTVCP